MRIGLILLSALVVFAFVGEASAGPKKKRGNWRSLSQDRQYRSQDRGWGQERILGCSSICRDQLGCNCPNGEMGPPVWSARDDLPVVSDNISITFS